MGFLFFNLLVFLTDGLAVMSVDLGSQFMKVAIVKVNDFQVIVEFDFSTSKGNENWFEKLRVQIMQGFD